MNICYKIFELIPSPLRITLLSFLPLSTLLSSTFLSSYPHSPLFPFLIPQPFPQHLSSPFPSLFPLLLFQVSPSSTPRSISLLHLPLHPSLLSSFSHFPLSPSLYFSLSPLTFPSFSLSQFPNHAPQPPPPYLSFPFFLFTSVRPFLFLPTYLFPSSYLPDHSPLFLLTCLPFPSSSLSPYFLSPFPTYLTYFSTSSFSIFRSPPLFCVTFPYTPL